MTTLVEIASKIADALAPIGDEIPNLQIAPIMLFNPTPPTLDIYPADPFQQDAAFGRASRILLWTIRARVITADTEAGQNILLQLMEPSGLTSVRGALLEDQTLDDTVESMDIEEHSGHKIYTTPDGLSFLGCEWLLKIFNKTGLES